MTTNDLGAAGEEFDTHQHQLLGNLPPSFVHAVMFESAVRLARPWEAR